MGNNHFQVKATQPTPWSQYIAVYAAHFDTRKVIKNLYVTYFLLIYIHVIWPETMPVL